MVKKFKFALLIIVLFFLSGCNKYHSKSYYFSHPSECVKRLEYCKQNYGTIMYENQDCKNAYDAYLELQQSDTNMKHNLH